LATAISVEINPDQLNFYLEGFAEAAPASAGERPSGVLANASREGAA
jgi:hypothetical protein